MKDIELINSLKVESIDAVITDPPYFINIKGMINTDNNIWDSIESVDMLVRDSLSNLVPLKNFFMFKYNVNDLKNINLTKEDRIYIYFYTYFYNIISSNILKDNATMMVFNTYDNCQMMETILNQLSNDFGYRLYDFAFFEYTKYNAHPKASIEKTSEYLIHVKVEKEKLPPSERTINYNKDATSIRLLNSSENFTLRDKEIYDSINIKKGYYVENSSTRIHDTQKPPRLLQYLISNFTNENDTILDTFSGSGSISMSCYELNRNFIACELSEENFKNSVNRLKHFKTSMPKKVFVNNLNDSHFSISNAQFKANKKYNLG